MRRFRNLIFLFIFFFNPLCFGQLTVLSTGEIFHEIPLIQSSQTKIDGIKIPLFPMGHALYTKGFFNIYMVELLSSEPLQYKSKGFLHLNTKEAIAIRMTFLLPISGDTVYSSMREALKNNKVDINREDIKSYLSAIQVSVKRGDSFVFLGRKLSNKGELIDIQIPYLKKSFTMSGSGLIKDIFSVWLENVSHDSSLVKIQKQLFDEA